MSNLNKDTEHTNGGGNVEEEVGAHGGAANRGVGGPESCERGAPEPRGLGCWGYGASGWGMGVLRDPSLGCGAEVQLWELEIWGVRELEHGGHWGF